MNYMNLECLVIRINHFLKTYFKYYKIVFLQKYLIKLNQLIKVIESNFKVL